MAAFSSGEAIQYPYLATMPKKACIASGVGRAGRWVGSNGLLTSPKNKALQRIRGLFRHSGVGGDIPCYEYADAGRYEKPNCSDGDETDDGPRRSYFLFPAHFGGIG